MTDINIKLVAEGEKEFKAALKSVTDQTKLLDSQMKMLESTFDEDTSKKKKAKELASTYTQSIEAQRQKVALLGSKIQELSSDYTGNYSRIVQLQTQMNKTQTTINQMSSKAKDLGINLNADATIFEKMKDKANDMADGLKKMAKTGVESALDGIKNKAKDTAKALGDVVKSAPSSALHALGAGFTGLAKTVAGASVAIGGAVAGLTVKAVQSFGELEQNLGGSEAVFGEYAESLQKTSEDAYKKMGTSQSEYLATANKMGALFQGSGVDQERSLELTTQAMQRATDMASVMGIDVSSALEAVTGAAKGNYTMMDNLGVAMNATTLDAYAAANGFDKAFKDMSNAENAEVSMQYFFEKTSQYAGNFEREATQTLSGSFGLLKASIDSFVGGLGNADADIGNLTMNIVDSFKAVLDNLVPVIQQVFSALPQVLDALVPTIKQGIVFLIEFLTTQAPVFMEQGMLMLSNILQGISDNLPRIFTVVEKILLSFGDTITNNLPKILVLGTKLLLELTLGIVKAIPKLVTSVPQLIKALVTAFWDSKDEILGIGADIVRGIWEGIKNLAGWFKEQIGNFFGGIVDGVKEKLGIHSPSKVFAEIGAYSAEGFGVGFKKSFSGVNNTVLSEVAKAPVTFSNTFTFNGGYTESDATAIMRQINRQLGTIYA